MNKKEVTFNVKYEIVLYTPVFNARCPPPLKILIFHLVGILSVFGLRPMRNPYVKTKSSDNTI